MNSRITRLAVMVLTAVMVFFGAWSAQATDSQAAYDQYLAKYKAYQDAAAGAGSSVAAQTALKAYQDAKAVYEKSLNLPTAPQTSAVLEDAVSPDSMSATGKAEATLLDAGTNSSVQPVASISSNMPPIPTELRGIIENLWSDKTSKSPDSAIQRLQSYIDGNAGSTFIGKAKYELARAYEWLKKDTVKAKAILKDLVSDPKAGSYQRLGSDRLKYLEASAQHDQWKVALQSKQDIKEASYNKYCNTSWFAIPVKMTRYATYLKDLVVFHKTQADYKKFQLWYEDMGARFAPPVNIVFNTFSPADGGSDPEGGVRLVYDNPTAWYARWKVLNEAKSSIDVQYFIVDNDIFGMSLCGLLLRKAREGVKIRFMMDARGTKGYTHEFQDEGFLQELAKYPNVEIKVFNPISQNFLTMFVDLRAVMTSDHDKIVVVDSEYAIIGGRNISKNYFVSADDMPTAFRDCDVFIHSAEVAKTLDMAFDEEFSKLNQYHIENGLLTKLHTTLAEQMEAAWQAMDSWLRGKGLYSPKTPTAVQKAALKTYNTELAQYKHSTSYESFSISDGTHNCPIKIIDKNSLLDARNDITDELVKFVDGAKKEIIIQNPYVVLTERAEAALQRASKRGVAIYIHTNSPFSTDSLATQAMFYRDWKEILKMLPTARIFVFAGQRKLHAKTFVFDSTVGIVGTYNMDYISEEVNSEVVAAMNSPEFANELRSGIMGDIAQSKEYKIRILPNGTAESVFGPDDLPGKNMWLLKALSNLGWLKPLI
ncbi:MAG: phosphatidylserine/phosphatidylglycerophosphate/cardiolipin synthase family protein [Candidatus Riflebacteria bacterium]|nr:phosphatidylserine/phosphatidylglycerophosphate/cardiolipin synthase family protein [Candidatus Riflebacteria bacterium]